MQAAGEGDQSRLGSGVDAPCRPGVVGADAGDVDDLPAAPRFHHLDGLAAALDHRDQIRLDHGLDRLVFHVVNRSDLDAGAVVVDQDVEPGESVQGRLDERMPVRGRNGVCPDGEEPIARKLALGPVQSLLVAPGDHDLGAHFQQQPGGFTAETGGTAGDDDDLVFHIVFHAVSFCRAFGSIEGDSPIIGASTLLEASRTRFAAKIGAAPISADAFPAQTSHHVNKAFSDLPAGAPITDFSTRMKRKVGS